MQSSRVRKSISYFASDDELVAVAMYRIANNDFAVALAVTVCRINEINAAVAGKSYQAKRLL